MMNQLAIPAQGNIENLIMFRCYYVDRSDFNLHVNCHKVRSSYYCENRTGTFQCHERTTPPAETTEPPTTTPEPTTTSEISTTTPVPISTLAPPKVGFSNFIQLNF